MDDAERLDLMQVNLDRVIEWVSRLDTKASIVLGIDLAMAGFLGRKGSDAFVQGFWPSASLIASLLLVGVSLAFLAVALFPRTEPPAPSVFYFGSVSDRTAENYHGEVAEMSREELLEDTTGQIHTLSSLVAGKYQAMQRSLMALFVAIVPWVATVVMVGV